MASFQFWPWVIWAIILEFFISLLISMWQKGLLSGSGSSSEESTSPEDLAKSIEEDDQSPTLDQIAVVENELEAEG